MGVSIVIVRKNQREVILDKIAEGTLPTSALSTKKKKRGFSGE